LKPRLLVVGAGPAGVAGALWARGRFDVTVLERAPVAGGQLRSIHFLPNHLPGIEHGDGAALADACGRQLDQAGIEVLYERAAVALEARERPAVRLEGGDWIEADAVLVATGLERRRLDVPGEREFEERGVSYSASRDRARFAGQDVLVVGGGDGAFENALLLTEVGCRVTLVVRDRPRARAEFVNRVAAVPAISVRTGTRVTAFLGDQRLRAVRLVTPGGLGELAVAGAVIKIGSTPNASWCAPALSTERGFVRANRAGRTGTAHVWAAGDVTGPALFAISVAEAGAALAVHDAWNSISVGAAR